MHAKRQLKRTVIKSLEKRIRTNKISETVLTTKINHFLFSVIKTAYEYAPILITIVRQCRLLLSMMIILQQVTITNSEK